jgi:DivIVA domain-containing protein
VIHVATEELETVPLRPGDIASQRFTIAERGYEPQEVHRFLQVVADHLDRLLGVVEWQRARVEHLEQRSSATEESAYDRISREFMDVVRRADEAAGQVRAKAEDERIALDGARQKVNRMMASAAEDAERVLLTARAAAERLVAEATRQVEQLISHVGASADAPYRDAAPNGTLAVGSHPGREVAGAPSILREPEFAEFDELSLEFDRGMFDLLGEGGE